MRTYSHLSQQQFQNDNLVNQVFITKNYEQFTFSKFNRNVVITKQFLAQAKRGFISPIIVNENLMVIDGQHRLKASEQIGVPITYIVINGLTEDDVRAMNTNQNKWRYKDFIESYANGGDVEYAKLIELINRNTGHYTSATVIADIAVDSTDRTVTSSKLIKTGKFKFMNYEKLVEFLDYFKLFKEKTGVRYNRTLCYSLYTLFKLKDIDLDRLIKKVITCQVSDDLTFNNTNMAESTRKMLEAYNHHIKQDSDIYLDFHINSRGVLVIESPKHDWAMNEYEKE